MASPEPAHMTAAAGLAAATARTMETTTHASAMQLTAGLLLALLSAASLNYGFYLQHAASGAARVPPRHELPVEPQEIVQLQGGRRGYGCSFLS
jgi:hypothetical protein